MTSKEVLEQMENEEVLCDYCNIKDECPHGMVCYGGEPIEPACFYADLTELIDYLAYCEDRGIEMNEVPNLRSL